jgi:hypothetical protein
MSQAQSTFYLFSLCEALVLTTELPMLKDDRQAVVNETAFFVAEQINCLPLIMRLLIKLGLYGMQFITLLTHGKAFAQLSIVDRRNIVLKLMKINIIPIRKILELIQGLAIFYFFEHASVQASLYNLDLQRRAVT